MYILWISGQNLYEANFDFWPLHCEGEMLTLKKAFNGSVECRAVSGGVMFCSCVATNWNTAASHNSSALQ